MDFTQDIDKLIEWFQAHTKHIHITMSMLEKVHSVPQVSAKSNFNFGKNVGIAETILKGHRFGLDTVTPKVWQKQLGVSIPVPIKGAERKKQTKQQVADLCRRLYPGCNIYGPKGGLLDGRSDALGICHYARLKYT